MQMLVRLMSQSSLMLSSFFLILFFILLFKLDDFHYPVFLITDRFLCIIWSAVIPSTFSFQLYSSVLIDSFLHHLLFISLLKFSLSWSTVLQSLMSIFMTITLSSLSSRQLISFAFSYFSGILSCFFSWTYSFVSSFCLFVSMYYVSRRSAMSPGLEKVA